MHHTRICMHASNFRQAMGNNSIFLSSLCFVLLFLASFLLLLLHTTCIGGVLLILSFPFGTFAIRA